MLRFEKKPEAAMGEEAGIEGLSPLLAKLLHARGVKSREAAEAFLFPSLDQLPDPLLMKDMDRAAARIRRALEQGERICVYGDYDVDGICATAILYRALKAAGAAPRCFIPSRQEEGYGMHRGAVERLAEEGVELIVTVDNGVKALEEIARCYELGMEVVVTDHHIADGPLPRCEAVVCHTRPDNGGAGRDLCGAGTAWKLVWALFGLEAAKPLIPLAGIATVADIMPLIGENRVLVAETLKMLNKNECQVGLEFLGRLAVPKGPFTAYSIGFGLGPRLNAAGRLGDAAEALSLLCTDDPAEAKALAARLEERNQARRAEEKAICRDVDALLMESDLTGRYSIVLKGDWNPGVIGLAAGRAAERYMRPTVLFSERGEGGMLRGSARSVPGVDLYGALACCGALLSRFGGHEAAAGASMAAENFAAFAEAFDRAVADTAPESALVPRASYELAADMGSFSLELARDIARLAPFGEGNPNPLFCLRGISLLRLRASSDGKHLMAVAMQEGSCLDSTMFFMGERMGELLDMERADVLCSPNINEYRGRERLQLNIAKLRPCLSRDGESYIQGHLAKFADAFSTNILYNSRDRHSLAQMDPQAWADVHMAGSRGALLLCFSPQGARYCLSALLGEREEEQGICPSFHTLPECPTAYNAVVFAPKLTELPISRYRHILLLDSPLTEGIVERIRALAPWAELAWGGLMGAGELLSALPLEREAMAQAYRSLKGSKRRLYNREEALDCLSGTGALPRPLAALCFQVMEELGFVERGEEGLSVPQDPPRRQLRESPTYSMMASLRGMVQ